MFNKRLYRLLIYLIRFYIAFNEAKLNDLLVFLGATCHEIYNIVRYVCLTGRIMLRWSDALSFIRLVVDNYKL